MPRAVERDQPLQEPAPQGERRAELRTPHSVVRVCFGFPTCRMGERDDYALDVIAHDLGNSKNSRLYRRLVLKDELVTEVSVMNETRQDPGALFILCELRPGVRIAQVEQAVREEIARQIVDGIAKHDLDRIRTQIRASFLFQDEAVLDLAMKLARFEAGTPEGYRTLEAVLPTYDSLKPAELRTVAARYFDFRKAVIVSAVPAAGGERPARKAKARQAKTRKAKPAAQRGARKRA